MHGKGALGRLGDFEEALQDAVVRRAAVDEEQVVVVESGVGEAPRVVDLLVQSHHGRHVVLAEIREVRFRCVQRVTLKTEGRMISK